MPLATSRSARRPPELGLLGARFGELVLGELGGAQQDRAEIERLEAGALGAQRGFAHGVSSSGASYAGSTSTELVSPCAFCTTLATCCASSSVSKGPRRIS